MIETRIKTIIEMIKERKNHVPHCLILPYPAQGHMNPMIQFSKRLIQKQVKVTLITVTSFWKIISNKNLSSMGVESISDGYDEGGFSAAGSMVIYNESLWRVGSETLSELIHKLSTSENGPNCVIFDALLPWALDVAKSFGLLGVAFFTQSCSVNSIYFHTHEKFIELPLSQSEYLLPGLPKLAQQDLPSFLSKYEAYPGHFDTVVNQFHNIGKADCIFANTVYELEKEVVDWLAKIWPLKTIGPSIPSMLLDKRLKENKEYGINLSDPNTEICIKWINDKPKGSVVYVSFGSIARLSEDQTHELAYGLKDSESFYLWVVRDGDQSKLPKGFAKTSKKGLIVTWAPQLLVLTHEAVGCFVTHCGWNSTLEAMSIGVPLIAMPLFSDQTTNAKFIADVWKIGVRAVADEKEIVRSETIKTCVKEIIETEKGNEIRKNALKWKNLAKSSVDEGGRSDQNIEEFFNVLAQC